MFAPPSPLEPEAARTHRVSRSLPDTLALDLTLVFLSFAETDWYDGSNTGGECGGPNCDACPTCSNGVWDGDETGVLLLLSSFAHLSAVSAQY